MHKKLLFVIFILAITIAPLTSTPESRVTIDWTTQTITSVSKSSLEFNEKGGPVDQESGAVISINKGRLEAYHEAKEKALQDIIRAVKKIRVDSEHRIIDLMKHDPEFQGKLNGVISGKVRYVEFPVDFKTSGCKAVLSLHSLIKSLPFLFPAEDFPMQIDIPLSTYYTSLIIDTRKIKSMPMIFPVVYNEEGLEIYGRNNVDISYAIRYGLVSYVNSFNEAVKHTIAGEHPYYTVALKDLNGCPVIADKDVKKIYSSNETLTELRKCRVIFIINKKHTKLVQ